MHRFQKKLIQSHWPLNDFDFKFAIKKNLFGWQLPRLPCQIRKDGHPLPLTSVIVSNISKNLIHFIDNACDIELALGEIYEMKLCFPSGKKQCFRFRVAYRQHQRFGAKLIDAKDVFKKEVGQLLLNTNPAMTPRKIFEHDFLVHSSREAISFSIVTDFDDFSKVLALRNLAYRENGKVRSNLSDEKMEDQFDTRSTILVAKHFSKVVASVRFINSKDNETGEHQQFLALPSFLPKNSDMIEITRICTHPDYRKSGLLTALFVEAARLMIMDHREWILGSATDKLLPLYLGMGFVPTGHCYRHGGLGDEEHEVIYAKKQDLLRAKGVSPWVWHKLYRKAYSYAKKLGCIESLNLRDKCRIALYQFIGLFLKN